MSETSFKLGIGNSVNERTVVFHGGITSYGSFGRVTDLATVWAKNEHKLNQKICSDLRVLIQGLLEFGFSNNIDCNGHLELAFENEQVFIALRFNNFIIQENDDVEKKLAQFWLNSEESSLIKKILYPHDRVEVRYLKQLNLLEWRIIRAVGVTAINPEQQSFQVFSKIEIELSTNHQQYVEMGDAPYEEWMSEVYQSSNKKTKVSELLVKGQPNQDAEELARVVSAQDEDLIEQSIRVFKAKAEKKQKTVNLVKATPESVDETTNIIEGTAGKIDKTSNVFKASSEDRDETTNTFEGAPSKRDQTAKEFKGEPDEALEKTEELITGDHVEARSEVEQLIKADAVKVRLETEGEQFITSEPVVVRSETEQVITDEASSSFVSEVDILNEKVRQYQKLLRQKEKEKQKTNMELQELQKKLNEEAKGTQTLDMKQAQGFKDKAMKMYEMVKTLQADKLRLEKAVLDSKKESFVSAPASVSTPIVEPVKIISGAANEAGIGNGGPKSLDESPGYLLQIEELNKKSERLTRALETEKQKIVVLSDRVSSAEKEAQSSKPLIVDLEKKLEVAMKSSQQSKKETEQVKQKLVQSDAEKNKIKNDLIKAQAEIKTLMKRQAS